MSIERNRPADSVARDIDTQSSDNPEHYQGLVGQAMERSQWFMGRSTDRPSVPNPWFHRGDFSPRFLFWGHQDPA